MSTVSGVAGFRFDEKTAKQLSAIYQTEDIKEMQRQYRVWFDPKPGERILDVGCGTGVNTHAISKLVGASGKVIGIDNSSAMLMVAREKASADNVEYLEMAVEEMDFAAASFDGIVCTQLLGYLADPVAVIRSLLNLIKPGGRVFVAETDWDTLAYNIPDKELQRKVTLSFTDHHGDGWVGRRLYTMCRQAGAQGGKAAANEITIELHPYVIHNAEYSIRKYGGPLSYVIRDYLLRWKKCSDSEVARWVQLLSAAYDDNTYFFSLSRFICILRKQQ